MAHLRVFKNLTRQESTPAQFDYWKQILRYGDDDNFPLRLARLVQSSPTAASCIDTKADFIEGSCFSDAKLADLIINGQGQRFGDFHSQNCDSYAMFEGMAILVKYNAKGNITEFKNVPFENCRFAKPDSRGVISKIKVNPYFGSKEYREIYTKEYDVYNPDPKAVLAQIARDGKKYKGQILYVATTGPLSRFYPSPKYYSARYFMKVDEAIGGFHCHNIENGFFQSVLFKMIGDETQPSTHPDDMTWDETNQQYIPNPKITIAERFNTEMQKFSGWEKAGNIMVQWAKNKDELPSVEAFPSTTNSDIFKTLQEITTENIARATKVPSILANIQSGATLGGDGNQIRASVKLMQQRVVKIQSMIERVYKGLLARMEKPFTGDVKILHYNPFPETEKIDPLVWTELPVETKLAWIKKNTDFELPETPVAAPAPAAATAPGAVKTNFMDVFYADYPAGVKEMCQKAKDFHDKMNSNCGGKAGWQITQDIIDSKPLSFKMIKRLYNFLNKNMEFKNALFTDSCQSLLFAGWGGVAMLDWAENKIKSINE